ncbi:Glycosyltransferase involved in cell wall bisynthesis [Lachnospiraceae bacterium]|nr:Glycosyltransferase involved in cell wall bisynthesis [Lachnospiraceae bacterium]
MRVLYFLAHPMGIGGAAKQMLIHARIIKELGNDVCVVVQNNEANEHDSTYDSFCKKYDLEMFEATYSIATCIENIDIEDSIKKIPQISSLIQRLKPDIVHSLQINTSVELACRELNIPHVMSIYPLSYDMFNLKWDDIFPRYLIGDSHYYVDQWSRGLGTKSKCIRVCYIKKEYPKGIFNKNHEYEFLSIGLMTSYKNQLEIIKFLERLTFEGVNAHLTLLGAYSTEYGNKCVNYVHDHNLEKFVDFKGFVIDVEKYFDSADALIHVSFKESYPGVIIEAMANRVPVIAYPAGGISELLVDGENGLLTEDYSADKIYDTFCRLVELNANGRIDHLIKNAYELYENYHSREAVSKELINYYQEILNKDKVKRTGSTIIATRLKEYLLRYSDVSTFTRRHFWYLWNIKRLVKTNGRGKTCIWGAGEYGKYALEWCAILGLDVVGFIDSNKKGEYFGFTILKPDNDHLLSVELIFVAIADIDTCRQVGSKLDLLGKKRNRDYFFLENDPCM